MSWNFSKNGTAQEVRDYVCQPPLPSEIASFIIGRIGAFSPNGRRCFVSCSGHEDAPGGNIAVTLNLVLDCCKADDASGNRCSLPIGHSGDHGAVNGIGNWTDEQGGWHRGDGTEISLQPKTQ